MSDPNSYMAETMPLAPVKPRRRGKAEYRMIAAPMDPKHTLLPAREMARAERYVMVRRPNCMPFVVDEEDWENAPLQERGNG